MNTLPRARRVQIPAMLCEGSFMRSISRVADGSIIPVAGAGKACLALHNETVRNVAAKHIEFDEIWSFRHTKRKSVADAKAACTLGKAK